MSNTLESCMISSPYNKTEECAKLVITDPSSRFILRDIMNIGNTYTYSMWVSSETDSTATAGGETFHTSEIWMKCVVTFSANSEDFTLMFGGAGTYYIYHPQLELGNKATDYTTAPEDTEDAIDVLNKSTTELRLRADGMDVTITQVQEGLQGEIDVFKKYFDFTTDGLIIGDSESNEKVRLDNDEMVFTVGDEESLIINPEYGVFTPKLSVTEEFRIMGYTLSLDESGNLNCDYTGINMPIMILKQPQDQTVTAGETAYFTVVARGENIVYQWQYRNNGPIGAMIVDTSNATATEATSAFTPNGAYSEHNMQCVIRELDADDSVKQTMVTREVVITVVKPETTEEEAT